MAIIVMDKGIRRNIKQVGISTSQIKKPNTIN